MSKESEKIDAEVKKLIALLEYIKGRISIPRDPQYTLNQIKNRVSDLGGTAAKLHVEPPFSLEHRSENGIHYLTFDYWVEPVPLGPSINFPSGRKTLQYNSKDNPLTTDDFSSVREIMLDTCDGWLGLLDRPELYQGMFSLKPRSGGGSEDKKAKQRSGRPVDADQQKRDKLIYGARNQENPTPYSVLGEEFGMTRRELGLAYDRARKRLDPRD